MNVQGNTAGVKESKRKTIFSGVQPSGKMTLGNYLGALKNWVKLQDEYDCFYSLVNLHAITVPQDPEVLRNNTLELMAQFLSCGIDPNKATVFVQAHVKEHLELMWILNCMTYMGELSRMTQYKDKSKKSAENLNAGLFTYPVLMAADILIYQADLVPVGDDQKQHMELARDLAIRFNNRYGKTFVVPEGYYPKNTARVMSLQDPSKKMSKSDSNPNGFILLADDADTTRKKIMRSVTDSVGVVQYSDDQPGIKNLLNIYSAISDKPVEEIVKEFEGRGYGDFKKEMAEVVVEGLRPVRDQYEYFMKNKDYLDEIISKGAEKARLVARTTVEDVYNKTGFISTFK